MGKSIGCARHSVCFLSFIIWLLGGVLLGCMMWMLATSPSVKLFFTGKLIFTYVILTVGSLLFISGFFGWMGSCRRGTILIKLFLFFSVLTIAAEIGGIVALNVLKTKMADVLSTVWSDVNQSTRNLVQEKMDCCGFTETEDPVVENEASNDNCYINVLEGVLQISKISRSGCKEKLVDWFYSNKAIWITSLGSLLLLQVAAVLLAVYVINQIKQSRRSSLPSYTDIHYHTKL